MKITAVQAFPLAIPLKIAFRISLTDIVVKRHVVVKIQTDQGILGYGEVGVLPPEIGGTMEALVSTINNYFAPKLAGMDPFDIEAIHAVMDKTVYGLHFAKAAVDIACHDIMGKRLGLPVYALIGGRVHKTIPVTWVLGIDSVEANVEQARDAVRRGFNTLKVKVGDDADYDVKRIAAIRTALGAAVRIRIDANQGYRPREAIQTLQRMEQYNLQCVEQPVDKLDLKGLAAVHHASSIPVMSDEAVYNYEDLVRVIELQAASIINIKLARVGGIMRGKKIAHMAEAAGLSCMLGCMLEIGPGIAAAAHVAASTPNADVESDLIGHLYHQKDIIEGSGETVLAIKDGQLAVPEAPGLGITVLEERLQEFRP
jgi:L-alanine-DL-glutamate epimerase-like enolase superfamily enzyme